MKNICFLFLITLFCYSCNGQNRDRVLVAVKRNYTIPKASENVVIAIPWKQLTGRLPQLKSSSLKVTDQNFGKELSYSFFDPNQDKTIDYLLLDYTFESNEPIFTFLIEPSDKETEKNIVHVSRPDTRLEISFLTPFPVYEKQQGAIKDVPSKIVQSTLNIYPDVKNFPIYAPHRWNYEYSFFLLGSYKLGKKTGNQAFVDYPKKWLDNFVAESGGFNKGVYDMTEYKLDDVIPARLAILFHQETKQAKYKSVADTIALQLKKQPKTSDGGYWHKEIYPNQMWLDGVFMGDVFSMQYAQAYNQPEWYDEAVHQIKLIYKHTVDTRTGLLYHGWDESKNPVWAHPQKGTSPEFWGRAIGWYVMALVECLDFLPENHPGRNEVIKILQDVSASVKKYQDKKTNLWFQVIDKADQSGNWVETSCSAMFAYAFAKGHHQGFLDKTYLASAQQAYDALLKNYVYADDNGNLHLEQTVKVGTLNPKTSKGDFQYYISTEKRIDDYKGLAALLYASMEIELR